MKFQLKCPNCKSTSSTTDDPRGHRVKCPKCGGIFRVQKVPKISEPSVRSKPPVVQVPEPEPFVAELAPPEVNRYAAPEAEQQPVGAPLPYWSARRVATMVALVPALLFAGCVAIYFATRLTMTTLPPAVITASSVSEAVNRLEQRGYERAKEGLFLNSFREVEYRRPTKESDFVVSVLSWLQDERIIRVDATCFAMESNPMPQNSLRMLEEDVLSLFAARDDYQRAYSTRKGGETENGSAYFGLANTSDGWRIDFTELSTFEAGASMATIRFTHHKTMESPTAAAYAAAEQSRNPVQDQIDFFIEWGRW